MSNFISSSRRHEELTIRKKKGATNSHLMEVKGGGRGEGKGHSLTRIVVIAG